MRATLAVALPALLSACGSSSAGSTGGSGSSGGTAPPLGMPQQGIATYYAATGDGACGFGPSPNDLDVAAMNQGQWAGSGVCGECVSVVGPKGNVTVRIVDECPNCQMGQLDLSQQAFAQIADVSAGRVSITWTPVACNVTGNVAYWIKDGSSQYWTAIQVRNSRLPIAKLEWLQNGAWTAVQRVDYNYFVVASGVGPGSYQVRLTAVDGQTIEDTLPPVQASMLVMGSGQFH